MPKKRRFKMKTKLLIATTALVLFGASFGLAQSGETIRTKVPFQFTVGSNVLPAGEYDFTVDALGAAIRVVSIKPGHNADILVLTRLSREFHSTSDAYVVFDVAGDSTTFSELWIPGADGYLVNSTKGKHTHKTVQVPHKK
jgi:hypothetical protein